MTKYKISFGVTICIGVLTIDLFIIKIGVISQVVKFIKYFLQVLLKTLACWIGRVLVLKKSQVVGGYGIPIGHWLYAICYMPYAIGNRTTVSSSFSLSYIVSSSKIFLLLLSLLLDTSYQGQVVKMVDIYPFNKIYHFGQSLQTFIGKQINFWRRFKQPCSFF